MSMNLHVEATRPTKVNVKGVEKTSQETISFDLWQTPTKVTYDILEQEDKLQAYIDWVKSISQDRQWPIYAEDDIFSQRDPIRFETVNDGDIHIEYLKEWIEYCNDEDFILEWYYM